jgi:hypothetical protein
MEKFDLILKELQKLNLRVNDLETNMVTKQDLNGMATKQDLDRIDTRLEQMSKKLDAVASQVAHKAFYYNLITN